MALPYLKPGVTVNEIVSPSLTPVLNDPNVIAIVGPSQGYEEHVEFFVLDDNHPVTLGAANANPNTIVVRDGSNVTLTPFQPTTPSTGQLDYDVDTTDLALQGIVRLQRSMQTTIDDGETVVVYFENSASPTQADAVTSHLELNKLTAVSPVGLASGTVAASIKVSSRGRAPLADFQISGEGGATPTIVWQSGATVLRKFQTVYLDYVVGAVQFFDQPFILNNLSAVALPANADDIVVKTAPQADTSVFSALYQLGTTIDLDYILTGSGLTTKIARSQGTTTIGGAADKLVVRVSYQATPADYYLPTRCFSQSDVEDKFGPAFDSTGNIQNPLSFGTLMAFQNGASQVIAQGLFSSGPQQPTGALTDWEDTLESLRNVTDVSVVVPIIASGDLSAPVTDSLNLSILSAVSNHVRYMQAQENRFQIAICGEDGTSGSLASAATLQSHADTLGEGTAAEAMVLVSPSSFTIGNPVTGQNTDIGGQYAAAALAGMLAKYPVQMPLTRKRLAGITSLKSVRTETQKDQDAGFGLCVIESKRGRIQVRHSITTAKDTRSRQELSVVRAKYWMLTNLVETLDNQVVGQLVLDTSANFTIQILISAELERLIQEGAIVSYDNIQVRPDASDATTLQVRFSYLPAYPLNHISISFSIDAAQGISFDQSTATQF